MKHLLIAVLITVISANCFSQVRKFKAFQLAYQNVGSSSFKWTESNVLVVIDVKGQKIKIYTEEKQDYDLLNTAFSYDAKNDLDEVKCDAIDTYGKKCLISLILFRHPVGEHIASITTTYKDLIVAYKLKGDD